MTQDAVNTARAHKIAASFTGASVFGAIVACAIAWTAAGADLDIYVRDRGGQPLGEVVVLLEPLSGEAQTNSSSASAVVDQLHQQFVPGVIAVRTGTAISFPNSDTVSHQVYSFSPAKRFELGLYRGVPRDPIVFDKPGIVVLGCNIHDNMIGYVYVTDAPYFGTTGDDGHLRTALPLGKYRAHVWSPRFATQDNATERELSVKSESQSVAIDIAGPVRASGAEQKARRLRDY
jgi:plastocyanin